MQRKTKKKVFTLITQLFKLPWCYYKGREGVFTMLFRVGSRCGFFVFLTLKPSLLLLITKTKIFLMQKCPHKRVFCHKETNGRDESCRDENVEVCYGSDEKR